MSTAQKKDRNNKQAGKKSFWADAEKPIEKPADAEEKQLPEDSLDIKVKPFISKKASNNESHSKIPSNTKTIDRQKEHRELLKQAGKVSPNRYSVTELSTSKTTIETTYHLGAKQWFLVIATLVLIVLGYSTFKVYQDLSEKLGIDFILNPKNGNNIKQPVVQKLITKDQIPDSVPKDYKPSDEYAKKVKDYEESLKDRALGPNDLAKDSSDVIDYDNPKEALEEDIAAMKKLDISTVGVEEIIHQAENAEQQGDTDKAEEYYNLAHGIAQELIMVYESGIRP